jgi:hypothetical protein
MEAAPFPPPFRLSCPKPSLLATTGLALLAVLGTGIMLMSLWLLTVAP